MYRFHPDFHSSNSQIQREMMQYMKDWVSKLPNQHTAMQRLGKNAVRNHENIRLAGEGGPPAAQGTFAETEAHQFQSSLQGFASSHVPGFSQAQSLLGGAGQGRDVPGGPGYPGAGAQQYNQTRPGNANQSAPPPMSGQAASYYGGTASAPPNASYSRPEGPPPGQAYGMPGGGAPSALGQQSYGMPGGSESSFQPGYAPSYGAPPQQSGPPSFPGSAPGYGGGPERKPTFPGAAPGYPGEPERRPTFPGVAPGFPGEQGGAPSFPGHDSGGYGYDNPPHGHAHGHGHGHGHHGHGHGGPPAFPGSEGPPGFPGAGGPGGFGGPPGPPGPGGGTIWIPAGPVRRAPISWCAWRE